MARPTKLTENRIETICKALRAGSHRGVAARAAAVSEASFYRWMEEGRNHESGLLRELYEQVLVAEAEAELRAVGLVSKAMPKDWRAAIAWLERARSERWGRRDRSAIPAEERPTYDLSKLTDAQLKSLERINARLADED
jgi:hypothetical protein